MNISNGGKNAEATGLITYIGNAAVLKVYDAASPANANLAHTGTVLATFVCASPFGSASNGVITAGTIPPVVIGTSGTAASARLFQADGTTTVCDFSVSANGGSGELQFPTVTFTAAVTATASSLTITEQ